MQVLLIQAYLGGKEEIVFPLGLSYIATALANRKHDVTVFDPNTSADPFDELSRMARNLNPAVVGVSLRTFENMIYRPYESYIELFYNMVSLIKEIIPTSKIVVGGSSFSIYPRQIMERAKAIDYGIFLEAEESLPELLDNLDHPELVKGVYYRIGDNIQYTGNREPLDFASCPTPRRDMIDVTPYLDNPYSMGVQSKRGCILECAYCIYPYLEGKGIRLRPAHDVVDELEELTNRYEIETFYFVDSVFNIPVSHAIEICKEIIIRGLNVRWQAFHNEKFIDQEYLELARDAGCDRFTFSPDGNSESTLAALNKNLTEYDLRKVYYLIKQVDGIKVGFHFFVNGPGGGIRNLISLCFLVLRLRIILRSKLDFIYLARIRIYPHTAIDTLACEKGMLTEGDDLLQSVFYNPPPLNYVIDGLLFPLLRAIRGTVRRLRKFMPSNKE